MERIILNLVTTYWNKIYERIVDWKGSRIILVQTKDKEEIRVCLIVYLETIGIVSRVVANKVEINGPITTIHAVNMVNDVVWLPVINERTITFRRARDISVPIWDRFLIQKVELKIYSEVGTTRIMRIILVIQRVNETSNRDLHLGVKIFGIRDCSSFFKENGTTISW